MKLRILFFVCLLLVGAIHELPATAQAQGSLMKASGPAVYYVADDGSRYGFPNEKIYFSWYNDFSNIQVVTDEQLAEFAFAGSITYRPDSRLVKLITDPKVYLVEFGGVLRWVQTETVARELYGDDWASLVDDLSDAFFPHYLIGEPVTDSSDLDLAVPEEDLNDPAQLNGAIRQTRSADVYPLAIDTPVLVQGAEGRRVFGFTIQANQTVELESARMRLRALTHGGNDSDAGGLVNTPLNSTNLLDIKIVDRHGAVALNGIALLDDTASDGSQTFTMEGSETLLPGRHPFYVILDVFDEAPVDEAYDLTLYTSQIEVDGTALGAEEENLESDRLEIGSGALTVELGSGSESQTLVPGEQTVDAVFFDLTMTGVETAEVSEIILTGYIDEGEGDPDFTAGIDGDNGAVTTLADVVSEVKLIGPAGTILGSVDEIGSDGRMTFGGLALTIESGETVRLGVRATVRADAPYELGADRFSFDIEDASEDIDLTDNELEIEGDAVNGGASPAVYVTVAEHGELTLTTTNLDSGIVVFGETDVAAQALIFEADEVEDFVVSTLSFHLLESGPARSIASYTLQYEDAQGTVVNSTKVVQSSLITFEDLTFFIPKDDEATATLLINIDSSAGGATSGDEIEFNFDPDADFGAVGLSSGEVFADAREDITLEELAVPATFTVRKNRPAFSAGSAAIASDVHPRFEDVLSVDVVAQGEGTTYIESMTFKIEPDDVGTERYDGSHDDDLLEYLADVNGDGADDNGIADLYDEETSALYGEDDDGHISFSIYDDSLKSIDTTPAGLDTARGDYGLITYEFTTPLGVGQTTETLVLGLDLHGFKPEGGILKTTLLGGANFLWNDGGLFSFYGTDAAGLTKSKTVSVLP